MKLRHLDIFYAVMTCGSLTRAAEVLHISQPAASKALKHAEQQLGLVLFQRIRGKLLPTDEALLLFEEAKKVYQNLDHLRILAQNLAKNPHGKLAIGCLPSLGLNLVPEVTALFIKKHPHIKLTIGTHHTSDILQLLAQQELDIGIGFSLAIEGGITVLPIAKIPLVYVDHLAISSPVSLTDIDQQRWIHPGSDSLSQLLQLYHEFPPSNISVHTYHMAAEFVQAGLGCSITDVFSAEHTLPDSMIYPLKEDLHLTVSVFHRADKPLTKAAQNYVNTLSLTLEKRSQRVNQKLYIGDENSIA
nr:LysR substrate-binding domain-containing protein [uncultured Moellerella sp.]